MLQLIRHATLLLQLHGQRFLIDPFLGDRNAYPPIPQAGNDIPIPMLDLPLPPAQIQSLLIAADAVIVTHLHRDHWDDAAKALISKDKLLLTQPESIALLQAQGYTNVQDVQGTKLGAVQLFRTSGQHGTGAVGQRMGAVSGVIFKTPEMTVYLAGDTIWCPEVAAAITLYQPDYIIVNAGAAQFLEGGPITMTAEDILAVTQAAPQAHVIAVHMDTVNHCFLTREILREYLLEQDLVEQVLVPDDGEEIVL
ncbi:L-ascorbate metabolism protein UlaG, beta-lactamase superfamily [Chitinophaga costaii]|uniref:L-ascorbate metabolism protein UlaG, beta-lactamase superfamily n=1 Tax=Chitinophaga costaii TaxID=1335309 RepID=A0A1C4DDX3_9BACT|nr:MBL fold metallo-hydrolase [Chitinophaga costaii]PUZ24586.1 MBL fold metallo-hydrolase [Chitinophaga costaii]SCC29574.1 L-ascorbate metabolism protein UlaG, beta-lactamase superfamily [Chitinophaga costaii]